MPIGGKPVTVILPIPRVECPACRIVRQVPLNFADPRRHYTRAFEHYALELSRLTTIQDAAHHLQVSWDTIKDIQKRDLQHRYRKPRLAKLKQIAIDEISIGQGHRYLTVVLNLESGAVVFVGEGKGADALEPFWKRLKAARARIEAVATDMSAAYIQAVRDHLGTAVHVFDHFHVIKLFNEKLSNFRRELHREATNQMQKEVLKGTRWLLLKNPENLDPKRRERERLDEALRMNLPLATVYSKQEGTNNKIKTMQRQAYGFRDQEFFKLKIYAIHEAKYALVG